MIESKTAYYLVFVICIITITSFFGNQIRQSMAKYDKRDEDALIQKYLLNDSPLYGYNKPKLWIHTKYEYNARIWKSFHSRSSTELNEPYIHLCIKSVIAHCGDDFNVVLIDDGAFAKLIPNWDVKLNEIPEPFKTNMRKLGFAQLLYIYGGIIVPNSFICSRNLIQLYQDNIATDKPFVFENLNNTERLVGQTRKLSFIPDVTFMGSLRNNQTIYTYVAYLKQLNANPHFQSETDFLGNISYWCIDANKLGNLNILSGKLIGTKTTGKKQILVENLFEEKTIALASTCVGIYIPNDTILSRIKYQWFAVMDVAEIIKQPLFICSFMKNAVQVGEYPTKHAKPGKARASYGGI